MSSIAVVLVFCVDVHLNDEADIFDVSTVVSHSHKRIIKPPVNPKPKLPLNTIVAYKTFESPFQSRICNAKLKIAKRTIPLAFTSYFLFFLLKTVKAAMSEFETDQDSFDNVFDSQDLEMTAAFEEQYVSSQAAPFFAALDDGPLPRTDFPSAPSPVQAPPPSPSAPPALHQHHHDYNPQLPQRRHSPTPSQRESEMHVWSMRTYRQRATLLTR